MARTLTANFQTAAANKSGGKPYLILEIQWTSGTRYYLDRPTGTFDATGTRHPATIQDQLVLDWGETALEMREGIIGGVDTLTIRIADVSKAIMAILEAANQQRREVKIWRLFDDSTCVWTTDAALMFHGTLKPFGWKIDENAVSLQVEDIGHKLLKTIGHSASEAIFEYVPPEYRDRHLPLVYGRAERAEAVCVRRPWATRTLEPIPGGTGSVTVDIQDHPDDIGIPTGTPIEVTVDGDFMTATFTQSSDPVNTPSTMTLTGESNIFARAALDMVYDVGTARYGFIGKQHIWPPAYRENLDTVVGPSTACEVCSGGTGVYTATGVALLLKGVPFSTGYKITFDDSAVNAALTIGSTVAFIDSFAGRNAYQAGVEVRPREGQWVYICNDLPSVGVIKVEGYGDTQDEAGAGRKDFILIGKTLTDTTDGTTTSTNVEANPFTINLDDDTWNLGTGASDDLGHNVTTITFTQSPRTISPTIEDNRLWVTLNGVDDDGDSTGALIVIPPLVILDILENPALCAISASYINASSFTTAAADSVISTRRAGFAILEPRNALELIQDIARQCHCAVFHDQGKVTIKVLANTSPGTTLAVNNTSADNILFGTLEKLDSDVEEVVSHVRGIWRAAWDDKTGSQQVDVIRSSSTAESTFGRRDVDFPITLYNRRSDVEAELDFWLTRWTRVYRHVRCEMLLDGLILQPADWVSFSYTDGSGATLYSSQAMEVLSIRDTPGECKLSLEARFTAFSY